MTTPSYPPPDSDRIQRALVAVHQRRTRRRRRARFAALSAAALATVTLTVVTVAAMSSNQHTLEIGRAHV